MNHSPKSLKILREQRGLWLFTDGGVIHKNPSPIGGSFAFVVAVNNVPVHESSGFIPPLYGDVTNNMSELYAVVAAVRFICENKHLIDGRQKFNLVTDSKVTAARLNSNRDGILLQGWPDALADHLTVTRKKIREFCESVHIVSGHPTKEELEEGFNKKGNPVHRFNVRCDELCNLIHKKYKETNDTKAT